jgi:two-component system, LuxR family, sensor kinase FixL
MNWVITIWSVPASACLTLGVMHLVIWIKSREAEAHLAFAFAAVAVAAIAACEIQLMEAGNPADFARIVRWIHVPIMGLVAALVCFVKLYFRTGRWWLGWAAVGTRFVSLVLNFAVPANLNYREITSLRRIDFFGQPVSVVAEGITNTWNFLGPLSSLLLVLFVVDASIRLWRTEKRDSRRRALVVGGSIVVFIVLAAGHTALIHAKFIQSPYLISLFFLGIIAAMAHELSHDVITAGRLTEELRESEQQTSMAAVAARLMLWVWDIPKDIIWVSPKGRNMYGVSPDETISLERFLATVHSEDRESVRDSIMRSLTGGEYAADYRVMLPDGAIRWITARGKVDLHGNTGPQRMSGVSMDITERRRAEEEAMEWRDELFHLSRVSSLGQLSGSLAHELNQPLGIILSNAQAAQHMLAGDSPDIAELREILADIVSEDLRAGQVITRLRALLKRGETRLLPLALNEVIEHVLRLLRSDLVARGVTIQTMLAGGLPDVSGDEVQLQQVLLNIITNACDAMAESPSKDRILSISTDLQSNAVRVSIQDRGRGFLGGNVSQIFQPFFTTKPHGLGIGLSICRSIIAAHHGRLWAEPNEGRGITLHMELQVMAPTAA